MTVWETGYRPHSAAIELEAKEKAQRAYELKAS